MSIIPISHPATGGMQTSCRAQTFGDNAWFRIIGFRPLQVGTGFSSYARYSSSTVSNFSVKDFANTTINLGSSDSGVTHLAVPDLSLVAPQAGALLVNKGFFAYGAGVTQTYGYVLVTQPTATTLTRRLLMKADAYNFTTAFAALGNTFEVAIDGAATFQWRVNGGAWTSLVPIATEVTVGTYYTLYFLTTTGFTIGENWIWRRTDSLLETSTTTAGPPGRVTRAGNDYIFVGYGNIIARAYFGRSGTSKSSYLVRSLGYRRTYGQHVCVFQDHLFIAGFSETSAGLTTQKLTLAWSDLRDFDNMYPTDTNEADSFTFTDLTGNAFVEEEITGMAVWGNVLYTFTQTSIWRTIYVGLPNVMFTERVTDQLGCISQGGVVVTPRGIYFPAQDAIYRYDGSGFSSISTMLDSFDVQTSSIGTESHFPSMLYTPTKGGVGSYNPYTGELRWTVTMESTDYVVTYKEAVGLWSLQDISALSDVITTRHQFFPQGATGDDIITGTNQIFIPVSTSQGTTTQTLITGVFKHHEDMGTMLELTNMWLDVKLQTNCTFTIYYQTADKLSDITLNIGGANWVSFGTWSATNNLGRLSGPRINFKYIAYKFVLSCSSNANLNNTFHGFVEYISGLPKPPEK